jgi:adenylate kinase
VAQAKALDEIVKARDPMIIIDIVAPDAELVRRLTSRMVCEKCGTNVDPKDVKTAVACKKCGGRLVQRSDDNNATVLERLKVYHTQTKPLVDFYQMRPTFRSVNGSQGPDQVAADLAAAIDSAMGGGASKEARL